MDEGSFCGEQEGGEDGIDVDYGEEVRVEGCEELGLLDFEGGDSVICALPSVWFRKLVVKESPVLLPALLKR